MASNIDYREDGNDFHAAAAPATPSTWPPVIKRPWNAITNSPRN